MYECMCMYWLVFVWGVFFFEKCFMHKYMKKKIVEMVVTYKNTNNKPLVVKNKKKM